MVIGLGVPVATIPPPLVESQEMLAVTQFLRHVLPSVRLAAEPVEHDEGLGPLLPQI